MNANEQRWFLLLVRQHPHWPLDFTIQQARFAAERAFWSESDAQRAYAKALSEPISPKESKMSWNVLFKVLLNVAGAGAAGFYAAGGDVAAAITAAAAVVAGLFQKQPKVEPAK